MKLRSIAVHNLRRFTNPVEITGLADGLNVLSAPNEQGKSTIFDGLQALFFIAHNGRPKEIQSLQPHAKGAPEVRVEIETSEGRFRIAKRWLSKPRATVHQEGRLIAQADAAEDWIARLAAADSGGPAGLLWVRQGLTGFTDGSRSDQATAREARRDLLSSVAGEVEAMTGGQRMDAALKRCREELERFVTSTGRMKSGGPWKVAQDRVDHLRGERDALASTAEALQEALAARKRARAELAELLDPEAVQRRKTRLAQATEAHAAAERHAEKLDGLSRAVDMARLRLDGLVSRRKALTEARAERTEAAAHAKEAETLRANAETAERAAEREAHAARDALKTAREGLAQADKRLQAAQRVRRAEESAARRADLSARLRQAEMLHKEAVTAQAAAKGPKDSDIKILEREAARLDQARALQTATAARLRIAYMAGRDGAITQDGTALPGDRAVPLISETSLHLDGIGTLTVTPADAGDDGAVTAAQQALEAALDRLGVTDIDAARAQAEARAAAERKQAEAKAGLAAHAPKGLEALRADLAALPTPEETTDAPSLEAAETARNEAETHRLSAEARFEAARDRLEVTRTALAHAQSAATASADRLSRASAALGRLGAEAGTSLAADLEQAEADLAEARSAQDAARQDAPDVEATQAALTRATSAEEAAQTDLARLRPEIARLDERITRGAEGAVEERLAEAEQDVQTAERELARIIRDVAILQRLQTALESARSEARERYFSPVANALRPLLHLLWPEAKLEWDDTELLPSRLIRNGQEEPISVLSGGTQEQLALLVRLAFARLLSQDGRAAPVILDDALVYTDDDRIERMFDALHRQAGDVQILVLTCRQRAFRELGGQQLLIRPATGAPDSLMEP